MYSAASKPRPRILRSGDSHLAETASLLVPLPAASQSPTSVTDHLQAARREGYEAGYREALAEMASAEATGRAAQLRRVADALATAAAALAEERAAAVQVAAAEAVELAYELTEALLQRELSTGRGALDAVRRALALAPSDEDLEVHLHPGDPVDAGEIEALVPGVSVKVVADADVEPGGCRLTAGPCRIDTQIGPAMRRARQVIAELRPEEPASQDNAAEMAL